MRASPPPWRRRVPTRGLGSTPAKVPGSSRVGIGLPKRRDLVHLGAWCSGCWSSRFTGEDCLLRLSPAATIECVHGTNRPAGADENEIARVGACEHIQLANIRGHAIGIEAAEGSRRKLRLARPRTGRNADPSVVRLFARESRVAGTPIRAQRTAELGIRHPKVAARLPGGSQSRAYAL